MRMLRAQAHSAPLFYSLRVRTERKQNSLHISFVIYGDLELDFEYAEVEEKIDEGKIYPFLLVSFACMMFLLFLFSS